MLQVFFSSYIFSTNVMVKVATRPAENPVSVSSTSVLSIESFHQFVTCLNSSTVVDIATSSISTELRVTFISSRQANLTDKGRISSPSEA